MATACERLDLLVKDYLLFRGFTATVKALDYEVKQDKEKGLRADRILENLLSFVYTYDLQHLKEYWAYLNQRFFSRLEQRYASSIRKLEVGLLKLYIVNAQQNNRQDRVRDFFDKMGPDLHNQQEFRDWFSFPFLPNLADSSLFAVYFTKQWQDTFQLSLNNFLQVVLQAMRGTCAGVLLPDVYEWMTAWSEYQHAKQVRYNKWVPKEFSVVFDQHFKRADFVDSPGFAAVPTLVNFDHDYHQLLALEEENDIYKTQMHGGVGSALVDKRTSYGKASKEGTPHPPPDLIYDFSGLAEESDSAGEKQKPARRFPLQLSTPSLKRKQESRADKNKPTAVSTGLSSHAHFANQSANNTSARDSIHSSQSCGYGSSVASVTGMSGGRMSASYLLQTSATAMSHKVGGTREASAGVAPEAAVVGGTHGKVPKELTSFPPYASPQIERVDLLPTDTGETGKPETVSEQGAASSDKNLPLSAEEKHTEEDSVVSSQEEKPVEFVGTEKLQELQADKACPFLMLSEDDYLEHQSAVVYSHFSPTGQHIASLDADGIVKVWTWSPQPSTAATVMSRSPYLSLDWASKSDRWLLLGNRSGQIRLFDTRDNKTFREASVDPPYTKISYLSACASTMKFAACQSATSPVGDGTRRDVGCLTVWDLRTMKVESCLNTDPHPAASACCTHNTAGKLLLAGGADGIIRLYDVDQQKCVLRWPAHHGPVSRLFFGAQDATCFSMGSDGKLCEWSTVQNGQPLRQVQVTAGPGQHVAKSHTYCLSKDKMYLLTNISTQGVICKVCESSVRPSLPMVMELSQHKAQVMTVDWSPNIETPVCATGAEDGCLKIFTLLPQ